MLHRKQTDDYPLRPLFRYISTFPGNFNYKEMISLFPSLRNLQLWSTKCFSTCASLYNLRTVKITENILEPFVYSTVSYLPKTSLVISGEKFETAVKKTTQKLTHQTQKKKKELRSVPDN